MNIIDKPRVLDIHNTLEVESDIGQPSFVSFTIVSGTRPYISWTLDPGGKKGNWVVQDLRYETYNVSSTIVPYDQSHLGCYGARIRNNIGSLNLNIELVGMYSTLYMNTYSLFRQQFLK